MLLVRFQYGCEKDQTSNQLTIIPVEVCSTELCDKNGHFLVFVPHTYFVFFTPLRIFVPRLEIIFFIWRVAQCLPWGCVILFDGNSWNHYQLISESEVTFPIFIYNPCDLIIHIFSILPSSY